MRLPNAGTTAVVVRLRAGTRVDGDGDLVEDWSTPVRTPLPGATVQAATSTEIADGARVRTITRLTLYAPGDPGITALDRIEVDGVVHLVNGPPAVKRVRNRAVFTTADLKHPTG